MARNLHALDASGNLYVIVGVARFAAALIFFPPFAQQRIDDLARDPAQGGRITRGSRAEAEVGVGPEEDGQVQGLRRSAHEGEEFLDKDGNAWDVKGFHCAKGRFDLTSAMEKIADEMNHSHENIMLDTRNLHPGDLAQLREAVESAVARGNCRCECCGGRDDNHFSPSRMETPWSRCLTPRPSLRTCCGGAQRVAGRPARHQRSGSARSATGRAGPRGRRTHRC